MVILGYIFAKRGEIFLIDNGDNGLRFWKVDIYSFLLYLSSINQVLLIVSVFAFIGML